jgi:radical SAM superfamily enzyme YgiQ (UPF0313 family)|tara:strand:+ start:328 stop:2190 length:1863 start_codon:yes stop_codon:yes gene_type:complete
MKKLKVLLTPAPGFNLDKFDIEHNKNRGYGLYPPIQLATISSSVLKKVKNIDIEILDLEYELMKHFKENEKSHLSARDFIKKKILDKIDDYQPDIVGISIVFSVAHDNNTLIVNAIKEKNPKITVVCGGNHPTFAYKRMFRDCPNIDFIFMYEGDSTFPEFIKYFQGKVPFKNLKGISWLEKETNEVKKSASAPLIENMDVLPIPSWNLVPLKTYQNYGTIGAIQRFGNENLSTYTMQTVRGCVASCTFCSVRSFYGKGVRSYSAKRVLKEIDYLYNDLGIRQLEIVDDDFTYNRDRTLEICNGLIKRNYDLIWTLRNGIRLGTISDEILHAMVLAKCRNFSIGVESGNDKTLKIIKKPVSLKMLFEKIKIFQRYPEVYIFGNFMVGFPWENEEETSNTFKLAEETGFDWNSFSVFTPLSGTPEFAKMDKKKQENFNFDSFRYTNTFELVRNFRRAIEKQMEDSLMHPENHVSNFKAPTEKKIEQVAYIKNLEINFLKNKNLIGGVINKNIKTNNGNYNYKFNRLKNLDRAIKDYEGIVRFVEKDHVIAHYCLAQAYRQKGQHKEVKKHINKVTEIISNPKYKKWSDYFNKLVPKSDFDEFKNYSINKNFKTSEPVSKIL